MLTNKKDNIIVNKSFEFSIKIIDLYRYLEDNWEKIISKQLLRSATSIWANLVEWNSWESKKDFLHKISISLKEAKESLYWLLLLDKSQLIKISYEKYIIDINEIIAILTKIIKTTKKNLESK